jgi:hypothetical protein
MKGMKIMFRKRVSCLLLTAIFSLSLTVNISAADDGNNAAETALNTKEKTVTEDIYSTNKSVQEDVYSTNVAVITPAKEEATPVVALPTPAPVKDEIGSITNCSVVLDNKALNIRTINVNGRFYAALQDLCYYINAFYNADVKTKTVNIDKTKKTTLKSAEKFVKKTASLELVKIQPGQYIFKLDNIDTCLDSYIYMGKSYVPIRYFLELFDKKIDYVASKNVISISKMDNPVIGTVNEVPLYKNDFDFFYNSQRKTVTESTSKENLESELKNLKQKVFDYIVEEALIKMNMPKSQSVLKDSDYEEINSYIKRVISGYGGIEKFRSVLAQDQVSFYQFAQYVKSSYITTNYMDALVENVTSTDEQIQKYFEDNKKSFVKPEAVKAKHILFMTRDQATGEDYPKEKMEEIEKKAKEVLKSIRDGADFDELMNKYGEDPGAKEMPEGYTFGKGEMVKEFEESAFSMKVGEVSDLVKTVYGYHIIKVVEKIPEKQLLLDEVKEDIKPELDQKAKSDYLENLLSKWKNTSKIKNNVK